MSPLLAIRDLSVQFKTDAGPIEAVDGIGFSIAKGEVIGLVGESGSGKSVTSLAIMRLIRPPGFIRGGTIQFDGKDLLALDEEAMRRIRGSEISMIPQSPRTSLNPVITVGRQMARLFELYAGQTAAQARRSTLEMLDLVGIPDPARRIDQYAHQLSGGMCQRIMIAMALTGSPKLVIADEPTTGLDVSIAARILDLLRALGARTGAAILLITHDLGVVAQICGRVAVMHAGQLVEVAPVRSLFRSPIHPYTRALLRSIPRLDQDAAMEPIPGSVPSVLSPPPGCRYAARCGWKAGSCLDHRPAMSLVRAEHSVACVGHDERRIPAS
jgi:oligopeptide/dipeptide ABC transporter ATP-binding protein